MATVHPWVLMEAERIWSEEEKAAWLAANSATATHVVTFEPLYQIEVCIPPWEQPDRQIARSAVAWGKHMGQIFEEDAFGAAHVVAAHHEGNALEVYNTVTPKPRLRRVT